MSRQKLVLSIFMLLGVGCNQYQLKYNEGFTDLAAAEKASCYYNLDKSGKLVSWAPETSITFYLENAVPDEYVDSIKQAAKIWKTVEGKDLIKISEERKSSSSSQSDGKNIVYWINDSGRFKANEQARTVIRWKKAKIKDADILINSAKFKFFNSPPGLGSVVHTPSLLMHEFGHALGMRHIPIYASLMYLQLGYLQVRETPHEADLKSMRCEYP